MLKFDKHTLERYLPSLTYAVSICEGSENADMHNFYLRELREALEAEHSKQVKRALTNGRSYQPQETSVTAESIEKQLAELWADAAEQGRLLNTVSFDHSTLSSPSGGSYRVLFSVDVSASTPFNIKV